MAFEGDTLVLGARTPLAVADRKLFLNKRDSEAFDEARVAALLAVACGRAVTPSELRYVRGALRRKSEGAMALALMDLALANLPKLQPPDEAAWRLSAADRLLKGGMAPAELLSELGLAPASAGAIERAYNPDQPRTPAGNGIESGRWTSGDDGAPEPSGPKCVQIADNSPNWAHYLEQARASAANAWPGAYYGRLAADALRRGDYSHAALYEAGALLDAAIAVGTLGEGAALSAAERKAAQLAANVLTGKAAENIVKSNIDKIGTDLGNQLTIATESGLRTRVDFVSRSVETGAIRVIEVKSSETAPLTSNRALALPEINSTGGTIVGEGKPGFPVGAGIPANSVEIIRDPKPED
jgi:hypothetical protein